VVIDAVFDKTIEKIRVKIRYLSGRECYVMDRLLACQPAGLVEHENSMGARYNRGGDLVEAKLYGFAVAGRLHEGCTDSAVEANCTQQVGRLVR
jgi:hypothetical protein